MATNKYMYAVDRSDEYLAHYGIKGMRWGVKKAIERGNDRALARQYKKASRKLAKLQKQASSGSKYARRAALLGTGAATMGGIAGIGPSTAIAKGTGLANRVLGGNAATKIARLNAGQQALRGLNGRLNVATGVSAANRALGGNAATKIARLDAGKAAMATNNRIASSINNKIAGGTATANRVLGGNASTKIARLDAGKSAMNKVKSVANNGISTDTAVRLGAGLVGAGLAAGAGYNAYRAATTKKAAKKAAEFQREMNQAFKGTKYANGGNKTSSSGNRKRRRRG